MLDTNILISASFWFGNPKTIIELSLKNKIMVFSSEEMLGEYRAILERDFFEEPASVLVRDKLVRSFSTVLKPAQKVFAVEDLDDNKVLEIALEAKADFIISGDRHLLKLKEFNRIRIVSAREFLELAGFA